MNPFIRYLPMRLILLAGLTLLFCGCAEQPLPPPTSGSGSLETQAKYAQWTVGQLELKRAQLRHELDRAYWNAGSPMMVMIAQGDRDDKQKQAEEIEAELLRRDPSGGLLAKSNALLADPR